MKLLLIACWAAALGAQTHTACIALRHHGKKAEAAQCFARLVRSADPYLRAEAYWGLKQYREANGQFRLAVEAQPKNADYRVRWGRLLLERFNPADAAALFQEALAIRKDHPGALLGLALIAAEHFERRAVQLAAKAAAADPKLAGAHELLARLALEENDPEKAIEECDKALAISPEALDAMAIRATIDWLNDRPETPWIGRILQVNPSYGQAYATGARFLVLNRRYEDGIRFYRKALELDPELWEARSELGINLMRLGQDAEARQELELCYENGYQNNPTVNALRLLDSYKNFVFHKSAGAVLKLHRKEAEALRPYFEDEVTRALRAFEQKYKVRLSRPVQVEVYPDHEDFAVRTLGMPGLGALGVTFGYVVAMDSPSGRKKGTLHWASTLWHELSHVYVLAATNHRVPRWFVEGMAVHEETAVSPDWGDRMDPEILRAVREKKLLPVTQLDRGFVRPSYPAQVAVSYFQAGRICDYIARTWGFEKLLAMMHGFAKLKTTSQVIQETLELKPEEFDARFLASLEREIGPIARGLEEWRKRLTALAQLARAGRHGEVIREAPAVRDQYPDYVEAGSAYELLAAAFLAKNDKAAAAAELERYARAGGRNPALIKQLASLQQELGRKKEAAAALARLIYIDPLDEEVHARLGGLWLELGNPEGAIREYKAVLALNPLDQAASHFNLAKAYRMANNAGQAKEHLFLALEAAPGYRPAQKMLLELSR